MPGDPKQATWQPISLGMLPLHKSQNNNNNMKDADSLSLDVRGGGIGSSITKVADYIGETKLRCWTVLGIAIVIEIASTTLLNVASNEKSPTKLALAMGMYLTRWEPRDVVESHWDDVTVMKTYGTRNETHFVAVTIATDILQTANTHAHTLSLFSAYTSLLAFATSLPQIDVSIAYAVWSACGTALVSAVMIIWFGEKADPVKIACIICIILGVVGLNLRDIM